ncbi:MAG: aminotransferase class III-fold pyridoxal phosphate-dependent enzyme, partial [Dehalococcoidia bacterium]
MTSALTHIYMRDTALRVRASQVIPGGMYGHQNAATLPAGFPQFFERGRGCRIWDVDGNEYIDFMCSYGPIVLGHQHPRVEEAAARQQALADCQNAPSERIVELAELLVAKTPHADWALFCKNGGDATTLCMMIARATTGRAKVLVAKGAYHGAMPWSTPRSTYGVTPEDRLHVLSYTYNDLTSVESAVETAGDDLAGIIATPFRHDAPADLQLVDPAFARGLRAICDRTGAALILDDVRAGFRFDIGGSWAPLGVRPDLAAYSKAIANGYPLAAVLGNAHTREGAERIYATGSFWFAAVPMAAALATLTALEDEDAISTMERSGTRFCDGLRRQAAGHGLEVTVSGPPQMPYMTFARDTGLEQITVFASEAVQRGVYLHPRHNWFINAALRDDDVAAA